MDIYSANNLIEVVKMSPAPGSFLRTRYMPTGPRDIFKTKKVFIERASDGNLVAPFVIPYTGSKLMEREAYTGEELMPAFLNPSRSMSIDQLMKKGSGETQYDETAPADREQNYLADDLVFLQKAIQRRIEWMIGQIITTGKVDCVIGDADSTEKVQFKYYGDSFTNKMTFTSGGSTQYWGASGVSIYDQVAQMANDIDAEYGDLDLILGSKLVSIFMLDSEIKGLLDIRNANLGAINPGVEPFPGVGFLGTINFGGKMLNIYSYNAKAKINGSNVSYIDPKYAVVIPRERFGATKFGAITQMEEEDKQFHTYAAEMVPRRLTDAKSNSRLLEMASAPLPHPYMWDSWRVTQAVSA